MNTNIGIVSKVSQKSQNLVYKSISLQSLSAMELHGNRT